jgi:hypothetical protein
MAYVEHKDGGLCALVLVGPHTERALGLAQSAHDTGLLSGLPHGGLCCDLSRVDVAPDHRPAVLRGFARRQKHFGVGAYRGRVVVRNGRTERGGGEGRCTVVVEAYGEGA